VLTIISQRMAALAKNDESNLANDESAPDIEQIIKRLDMLDRRLDNVDSIVSAVAERVMKQPITFNVTCSKCGQKIEIAIIGTEKPSR
jgi:tRNA(Ser,Leu) C12 N-acetylase TAN1